MCAWALWSASQLSVSRMGGGEVTKALPSGWSSGDCCRLWTCCLTECSLSRSSAVSRDRADSEEAFPSKLSAAAAAAAAPPAAAPPAAAPPAAAPPAVPSAAGCGEGVVALAPPEEEGGGSGGCALGGVAACVGWVGGDGACLIGEVSASAAAELTAVSLALCRATRPPSSSMPSSELSESDREWSACPSLIPSPCCPADGVPE